MNEKFESKFLLSDEEIISKGISKNEIENFRRKAYQVNKYKNRIPLALIYSKN